MNTLKNLNGWADSNSYTTRRSAQSYLHGGNTAFGSSGCGSGCGTQGEDKPKPSACGAGDEESKPQPSACGAGDEASKTKPAACGSGCGAEGK